MRACARLGVDRATGFEPHHPCVAQLPRQDLGKVHGPPSEPLAWRLGVVHLNINLGGVVRPLAEADLPVVPVALS